MSIPAGEIIALNQSSFRKPLLFYLKTNAEPRVSLKLMQITRYFCFKEFPYKVVEDLRYEKSEWKYFPHGKRQDGYQTLEFDNVTKPLWIKNKLVFDYGVKTISQLLLKTALCDITVLDINKQNLKLNEFKFLVSSNVVENIFFCEAQVFCDDERVVPLDEIVKLLPCLKNISWSLTDATSEFSPATTSKLIENLNPSILNCFEVYDIPEIFDFKLFAEFMEKNPLIHFFLDFTDDLSDSYVEILQAYVDKLVKTGEYKKRKILIEFSQQNEEFYNTLNARFWDE